MNIKTVCKLYLKREEGFGSYTDYEIYPLASMFADSDDDALASYITKIPSKYMEIINNACRRGVTIWHNHANVGNFSLDNKII